MKGLHLQIDFRKTKLFLVSYAIQIWIPGSATKPSQIGEPTTSTQMGNLSISEQAQKLLKASQNSGDMQSTPPMEPKG